VHFWRLASTCCRAMSGCSTDVICSSLHCPVLHKRQMAKLQFASEMMTAACHMACWQRPTSAGLALHSYATLTPRYPTHPHILLHQRCLSIPGCMLPAPLMLLCYLPLPHPPSLPTPRPPPG
jgi:hypothetical protein